VAKGRKMTAVPIAASVKGHCLEIRVSTGGTNIKVDELIVEKTTVGKIITEAGGSKPAAGMSIISASLEGVRNHTS